MKTTVLGVGRMGRRHIPPTGEDGRLAVEVLVAAHVSDENGHIPVRIDDHLSLNRVFTWA